MPLAALLAPVGAFLGTTAGAATIGAAAGIGGALIGGGAAKSAANTQAQAAQNATQAQLQAAQQASATQMAMYHQTRSDLAPYMTAGNAAMQKIAQMWGLDVGGMGGGMGGPGGSTINMSPDANGTYSMTGGQGPAGVPDWSTYMQQNPDVASAYQNYLGQGLKSGHVHMTPDQFAQQHYQTYGQTEGRTLPNIGGQPTSPLALAAPNSMGDATAGTGMPDPRAAMTALTQFPGYQFGLDQGMQGLDRSAAARGMLLTGGQLKDASSFATNYAMQNAWGPYMAQLNSLLSSGQSAAAGLGANGLNTGDGIATTQLGAGNASAQGFLGGGQALASGTLGVGGALQSGLQNSLMAYQLGRGGAVSPLMLTGSSAVSALPSLLSPGGFNISGGLTPLPSSVPGF